MFYVSAMSPVLFRAVFLAFDIVWSLSGPEWILDIALHVLKSFLLPFSFEMRLLYLLPKSLLLAIYAGRSPVRRKDLLYKK
jgi:hypothetical protein